MYREHRHLHRERGEKAEENPHLLVGRELERIQVVELEAAALDVQVDQPGQHENRAEEGVQKELDRRVDPSRPTPDPDDDEHRDQHRRSEEHTSELQSLMRISYAVFCLKKKKQNEHVHII